MARTLIPLLAFALAAQAQVTLSWKHPNTQRMEIAHENEQTLVIADNPVETSSGTTMVIASTSKTIADGGVEVDHKMESLRSSIVVPGIPPVEYDSTKPDKESDNPIVKMIESTLKATAGLKWQTQIDADGKVTGVTGFDKTLDAMSPEVRQRVAGQFATDYQVQVAQQELDALPKQALRPGDTWERDSIYRIEQGQELTFSIAYRYDGTIERGGKALHTISMRATDVGYAVNKGGKTPFALVDQDLRVRESSGHIHFDNEAGQVVDSTMKTRIVGSMTFGGDLKATLDTSFYVSMKALEE